MRGSVFLLPENHVYGYYVKAATPPSPKKKDFLWAFSVGGTICTIGQLLFVVYEKLGITDEIIKMLVPSTIVISAAVLTGIGVFDKIARRAGAGTLVPITGFANAVAAPAIEFKNEGYVLGVGSNLFKIAGPVIAYGTAASTVYGIIYYVVKSIT